MSTFRGRAIAALLAIFISAAAAQAQIVNPISAFPINVDGQFSGAGEWTDITPAYFVSNAATGATPTISADPNANSLLFAGLARDNPATDPELYLMYDYLGRQSAPTLPGEFLGNVSFPIGTANGPKNITVTFNENAAVNGVDITVNLHDNTGLHNPAEFGMEGALGFGTTPAVIVGGASPFATTPHLLMELEIPLLIPPGFGAPGGPFRPNGIEGDGKGDGYSPAPAFWGSNINKDTNGVLGDPPASAAIFTINPDGSTLIIPHHMGVPEPSTLVLAGFGALGLWALPGDKGPVRGRHEIASDWL